MPNLKITNAEPTDGESIQIITHDIVKDVDGNVTETNAGGFLIKPGESHTLLVSDARAVRIESVGSAKVKAKAAASATPGGGASGHGKLTAAGDSPAPGKAAKPGKKA